MKSYEDYLAEAKIERELEAQKRGEVINAIEIGMGASYGIGSDSYPYFVVGVNRFKSGAKKGQVKEVLAQSAKYREGFHGEWLNAVVGDEKFEINENAKVEVFSVRKNNYLIAEGEQYGRLSVGQCRDYRDPHF